MRARIYNEEQKKYYISEVYGIINRAGDWYIVDDSVQKEKLVLVEYLNFKTSSPYKVNIEIIDYNPINSDEWLNISRDEMNTINKKIKNFLSILVLNTGSLSTSIIFNSSASILL